MIGFIRGKFHTQLVSRVDGTGASSLKAYNWVLIEVDTYFGLRLAYVMVNANTQNTLKITVSICTMNLLFSTQQKTLCSL